MSELQGIEYAAARAMIDDNRASAEDIEIVISSIEEEQDDVVREHKRAYLKVIGNKNPEILEEIRRKKDMDEVWMEVFKDEIKARMDAAEKRNLFMCRREE